ncbi:glycine--tRNA ligase subunit beta [Synechococcales cyanobacterium C]|uniref:Glycine--tRNA ligase beta subunit n=1 Tax=Petrachloros mirabilis ULC683 TaxID=2781853 RepID=A0A8K2A6X3_9CYAN|nr:glycine--tRNA ligase subunit beta [Petrachloros mirabilis]NCJ05649.1 glycine--tRNA ligase subunit beta [Petrachloros mirabilis ULC683]
MATFLLEVGTEELPASFVAAAIAQWRQRLPEQLEALNLTPTQVKVYGTPRRLALVVEGLLAQQPDQVEEVKGPPSQAAFKDGHPTKAAEGFARKQGVKLADLELRDTDKGEFVFVRKLIQGRPTSVVLAEQIPDWIWGLEGKRFMRWGDGSLRFSRPVRWLLALLDDQVIPVAWMNGSVPMGSDRTSRGHRVLHPEPVALTHAQDYVATLGAAFVQVDPAIRRDTIVQQVKAVAKSVGGTALIPDDLLSEVVDLVEWPTAVVGSFETDFLQLPQDVITTEMISHQRYFPVYQGDQPEQLLPYFITVSNGDPAQSQNIASGNERVIRARLADGQFFYQADQAKPLADYVPQLETVTFQADLGSVLAKTKRIQTIAQSIATQLHIEPQCQALIQRAAYLCKADLVTQMVGEFPELQGRMGQTYARLSGEPPQVADAIFEHYLPRGADDALPQTRVGQVVALADRIDTLVSIFGLGMLPTGSSDPFGLRRAANGIVNILWDAQLPLNLSQVLMAAAQSFTQTYAKAPELDLLVGQLKDFFRQRLQTLLQEEQSVDYDLVNAVLGEDDPELAERALADAVDACDRAHFWQSLRADGTLNILYETINRATRLARQGDLPTHRLDPAEAIQAEALQQDSERAFYEALVNLLPETQAAQAERDYHRLVKQLQEIAPLVSAFFDGEDSVLVMADDPTLRQNRLNLLGLLRNHGRILGDFGAIVKG